jgi:dihydroneopterin triphosphate diphosphatase
MAKLVNGSAEVCVFRFRDNGAEYLLLKRSPAEKNYPNLWQYVSGSLLDDEKAYRAALRELKEETGLAPIRFWVVPHTNVFYVPSHDIVNLSPVFAAQVSSDAAPVLSIEHSAYEWLPFASAVARLVWPGQRTGLEIVHQYILGGEQAGLLTQIPL